MRNARVSNVGVIATVAPVELHYWPLEDIHGGGFSVALCGDTGNFQAGKTYTGKGSSSYTCPDCMLRYSLLGGGDDA